MTDAERPVAPFVLSLIGGIFILLGAMIMSLFAFGATSMMGMSMMTGMMSDMQQGMGVGVMIGLTPSLLVVGLASGIMVLLGAVMLYMRPYESQLWGAIIMAFSVVSILGGMGGFLVGLILGLVGGILALTWKPTPLQHRDQIQHPVAG